MCSKRSRPVSAAEFQKGIDYIGDLGQFDRELKQHVAIAEHFGYKLSVHSGRINSLCSRRSAA